MPCSTGIVVIVQGMLLLMGAFAGGVAVREGRGKSGFVSKAGLYGMSWNQPTSPQTSWLRLGGRWVVRLRIQSRANSYIGDAAVELDE